MQFKLTISNGTDTASDTAKVTIVTLNSEASIASAAGSAPGSGILTPPEATSNIQPADKGGGGCLLRQFPQSHQ